MEPLTNLDRYEFGMRYTFYARAAEVVGIKESTRNYLLDHAHFWYIAYCYGKRVAQAEAMPLSGYPQFIIK
jgi:hypothetical protein